MPRTTITPPAICSSVTVSPSRTNANSAPRNGWIGSTAVARAAPPAWIAPNHRMFVTTSEKNTLNRSAPQPPSVTAP